MLPKDCQALERPDGVRADYSSHTVIAVEVHKFADRGTLPLEGFAMRDNSFDRTIERNYVQKWRFLIKEY
ncbi:hypothetical protein, partial [Methylobacterium sp. E-066]|uniref:hypothetical protein n=1 Tax=Methylobacterium sp. E-066 TaxID=2836584 RepID=UPI001FB97530